MSALVALSGVSALTGPVRDPLTAGLSEMRRAADRLVGATILKRLANLSHAIEDARSALAVLETRRAELLSEVSPATDEQIEEQLERLTHAFPEGSPEDLAGYGAQLADDVIALRPSWRALRLGCADVRLHRRYARLPAIGTVWDAIRTADDDVRATTKRLDELPDRIRRAEEMLAKIGRHHRNGGIGTAADSMMQTAG